MFTLIEKDSKISKFIFDSEIGIDLQADKIVTPNFIIADLNIANAELLACSEIPTDWIGNKYLFDNNFWTLNPNYEVA